MCLAVLCYSSIPVLSAAGGGTETPFLFNGLYRAGALALLLSLEPAGREAIRNAPRALRGRGPAGPLPHTPPYPTFTVFTADSEMTDVAVANSRAKAPTSTATPVGKPGRIGRPT